jgi:hypothetical protein
MAKRRKNCTKLHCTAPPFLGGLCERHHEEAEQQRLRHDTALAVLNTGQIDNESVAAGPLRDEFWRLRDWWFAVCNAVNAEREHPVLRNETQYAVSWCVGLAESIVDEEREHRAGKEAGVRAHECLRRPLWERFENLQRGLMSNGVARPAARW